MTKKQMEEPHEHIIQKLRINNVSCSTCHKPVTGYIEYCMIPFIGVNHACPDLNRLVPCGHKATVIAKD